MTYIVIPIQPELLGWNEYHLVMSRTVFSFLNNGQKIGQCNLLLFWRLLYLSYISKVTVVINCTNILKHQKSAINLRGKNLLIYIASFSFSFAFLTLFKLSKNWSKTWLPRSKIITQKNFNWFFVIFFHIKFVAENLITETMKYDK